MAKSHIGNKIFDPIFFWYHFEENFQASRTVPEFLVFGHGNTWFWSFLQKIPQKLKILKLTKNAQNSKFFFISFLFDSAHINTQLDSNSEDFKSMTSSSILIFKQKNSFLLQFYTGKNNAN